MKLAADNITEYQTQANGARLRSFDVRGVRVTVQSSEVEKDAEARALASKLAACADGVAFRWTEIETKAEAAVNKARNAEARAIAAESNVPPATPTRLLGVGCVRFDDMGRLYLLSSRERGWESFAVIVDGWDDLFRRYAVRVTAHGTDACGCWWEVVS